MFIHDLVHQANARKRKKARKALACRWAVGLCVATTAASLGIVTGVLIAPKPGVETRADLKRKAEKSVNAIKEAMDEVDAEK